MRVPCSPPTPVSVVATGAGAAAASALNDKRHIHSFKCSNKHTATRASRSYRGPWRCRMGLGACRRRSCVWCGVYDCPICAAAGSTGRRRARRTCRIAWRLPGPRTRHTSQPCPDALLCGREQWGAEIACSTKHQHQRIIKKMMMMMIDGRKKSCWLVDCNPRVSMMQYGPCGYKHVGVFTVQVDTPRTCCLINVHVLAIA